MVGFSVGSQKATPNYCTKLQQTHVQPSVLESRPGTSTADRRWKG